MRRNLKIVMLAPTPYFSDRGCHVRIYEEAKALQAHGHQVVIVTYHLGRNLDDIPVVRIPKIPWYNKLSAGPSWHKPYLDILLLYKSLVVTKKFQPDIIHAHLHEGAFLAAIAKHSFKKPVVFDCQGSLTGELLDHKFMKRNGLLHKFFLKLEAWITRQSNYIITSSTSTARRIQEEFPGVTEKLRPLIDAVDTDVFKSQPKNLELRSKLGLPEDKILLVYLGALTRYQGIDLLLEAIQGMAQKRTDFHLLLMGYPEEHYARKIKLMGLEKLITLTGKINYFESADYLNLGDIALSPKLSETEANGKLLNYMACGLPCVVFENKINLELMGEFGHYVPSVNASAYAQGIEKLMDDNDLRQKLSSGSLRYVQEHHSWKARISDLEHVYQKLAIE